jgi:exosome complex component RRP43
MTNSLTNLTVETGTIQPSSFVIDAETFQKLQPKEYLRRFLRNNTRPDGRPLTRSRNINIAVGKFSTGPLMNKMSSHPRLGQVRLKLETR